MTEETQQDHPEKETQGYLYGLAQSSNEVNHRYLLAHIAFSLHRIAVAQEMLVSLSQVDLSEQIDAAIEQRGQERAQEIEEERGKRRFIGKEAKPPEV